MLSDSSVSVPKISLISELPGEDFLQLMSGDNETCLRVGIGAWLIGEEHSRGMELFRMFDLSSKVGVPNDTSLGRVVCDFT